MGFRRSLAVLGWLALSLPGLAQDDAPQAPAQPAPEDVSVQPPAERPQAPDDPSRAESESESESESDDPDDADDDEFIFSEEIPADEQLVFPVDI